MDQLSSTPDLIFQVVMRAEALSRKEGYVGAVTFSCSGDPATGDFSDATVIRKFGDVPDDLKRAMNLDYVRNEICAHARPDTSTGK
jgi:hypothetical protein